MIPRILKSLSLIGLLLSAAAMISAAPHNTLLDVRVGPHKSFDRVVFEFQSETMGRVQIKDAQKIEVRFNGVNVSKGFALPSLPPGLTVLKRLDAYKEGENDIVFVIFLGRDATTNELPLAGEPWRLAIDLSPRVTETPDKKPEYIPGDLPIPTTLAERPPLLSDSLEPARVHAVLAYYYLTEGDSPRAAEQAKLYKELTGTTLNLSPDLTPKTTPQSPKSQHSFKVPQIPLPGNLPLSVILGIVFGAGIGGGILLRSFLSRSRTPRPPKPPKAPKPPKQPKQKKVHQLEELTSELEQDMQVLDEAMSQEPVRKPVAAAPPPPPPEPEPVLDEVPAAEEEMRESLMDRRVRRVLELNKQGASLSAIAEELQMGQDEVKLILDLNQ